MTPRRREILYAIAYENLDYGEFNAMHQIIPKPIYRGKDVSYVVRELRKYRLVRVYFRELDRCVAFRLRPPSFPVGITPKGMEELLKETVRRKG